MEISERSLMEELKESDVIYSDDVMYSKGNFKEDIKASIRSRTPITAVEAIEEKRFLRYMAHFSKADPSKLFVWDMVNGLTDMNTFENVEIDNDQTRSCSSEHERILAYLFGSYNGLMLSEVNKRREQGIRAEVYILLDFQHMLEDPRVIRRMKSIIHMDSIMSAFMVGHSMESYLDKEMSCLIPVFKTPIPCLKELKRTLYEFATGVENILPDIKNHVKNNENAILSQVEGLPICHAERLLARNVVLTMNFLGEKDGQKKNKS